MRTRARLLVALSMIALAGAVAPNLAQAQASVETPTLQHYHQTGLALMPGLGYRVIAPYRDGQTCGDSSGNQGKRVCTSGLPAFLDLQLSYGVTQRLDLIVDMRFGLAHDPATVSSHQFALAPGIRFWLDQDSAVKFYTTVQVLYDSTDYNDVVATNDFGVRNSNGLMYDAIRNVGFYFQFGESFGFRRWFRIELDAGLGVQVRFP